MMGRSHRRGSDTYDKLFREETFSFGDLADFSRHALPEYEDGLEK
jgi:hypothetical protein